jgi:2-polyprenyl-3-methyl-5-hydroxy-6-metoxy-1,4-benzoquinol methylase
MMTPPSDFESLFERRFFEYYQSIFKGPSERNSNALAWGAPESFDSKGLRRKRRQVAEMLGMAEGIVDVACDVTGGAGHFSLPLASRTRVVFNVDLDMKNLNYVWTKAESLKIANIILVRGDLFKSPLAHAAFDLTVCTDTLIYGRRMIRSFLGSIVDSLKTGGIALIDFYNRLHRNPLHKPYLQGYSRAECESFLSELESTSSEYRGFFQEWGGAFSWPIPPTRHVFAVRKLSR